MLEPKGLKLLVLSWAPAEVKLSLSAFGKTRIRDEIHPFLTKAFKPRRSPQSYLSWRTVGVNKLHPTSFLMNVCTTVWYFL